MYEGIIKTLPARQTDGIKINETIKNRIIFPMRVNGDLGTYNNNLLVFSDDRSEKLSTGDAFE